MSVTRPRCLNGANNPWRVARMTAASPERMLSHAAKYGPSASLLCRTAIFLAGKYLRNAASNSGSRVISGTRKRDCRFSEESCFAKCANRRYGSGTAEVSMYPGVSSGSARKTLRMADSSLDERRVWMACAFSGFFFLASVRLGRKCLSVLPSGVKYSSLIYSASSNCSGVRKAFSIVSPADFIHVGAGPGRGAQANTTPGTVRVPNDTDTYEPVATGAAER